MPRKSAARESPAMRPPPTREVVLMSSGTPLAAPSVVAFFFGNEFDQRRQDAAAAEPERRRQVHEAAERRRVGARQDDRVDDEVGGLPLARRLHSLGVARVGLQNLPQELGDEPDAEPDVERRVRVCLRVGDAAQRADELVGHRRLPLRLSPASGLATVFTSSTGYALMKSFAMTTARTAPIVMPITW